jgi:lipid II:glycine glycyltransferase (peptidoglycan interpeptide bridge formation enzyme)
MWLAERDGKAVAGAIMCHDPNHVCYWHGAADAEAFKLQPVNLLIATVIQDACGRGAKWFDFLPSGGIGGVAQFKKSFGAEARACPLIRVNTAWSTLLERTRSMVRRRRKRQAVPRAVVQATGA